MEGFPPPPPGVSNNDRWQAIHTALSKDPDAFGTEPTLQQQQTRNLYTYITGGGLSLSTNTVGEIEAMTSGNTTTSSADQLSHIPRPSAGQSAWTRYGSRAPGDNSTMAVRYDLTPDRSQRGTRFGPDERQIGSNTWYRDAHEGLRGANLEEMTQIRRDVEELEKMHQVVPLPLWFKDVIEHNTAPRASNILIEMPFTDATHNMPAPARGVIVIRNPYYYVNKQEVGQILSRQAGLVAQPNGAPYYAIHINMMRDSGKTGDIYIECKSQAEAESTVRVFQRRQSTGRPVTLGRTTVHMEVSSQEEMMQAIFPAARRVSWVGQMPVVDETVVQWQPDRYTRGFDGFLPAEEANLMLKYLGDPSRSPFLSRGPHRIFDAVIILLAKFPVWAPHLVTLRERKRIYNVAYAAVMHLVEQLSDQQRKPDHNISIMLLKELMINALTFKMFSEKQKARILHLVDTRCHNDIVLNHGLQLKLGGVSKLALSWPWLTLTPQHNVDAEFMQLYVTLLTLKDLVDDGVGNEIINYGGNMSRPHFGADIEPFLNFRVDYGIHEDRLSDMSFADCAALEMSHLRHALLAAVTGHRVIALDI